jgi:hypothetical protein
MEINAIVLNSTFIVILVFSFIPLVRWLIMSSIFQFFLIYDMIERVWPIWWPHHKVVYKWSKKNGKKSLQVLWRCEKLKVRSLCVLLVYRFGTLEWQYRVLFGIFFCFASGSLMLVSHFLVWLCYFRRSILSWYVGVTFFSLASLF